MNQSFISSQNPLLPDSPGDDVFRALLIPAVPEAHAPSANVSMSRFSRILKYYIESPWSPPDDQLPIRRTPEEAGNSGAPYRQLPASRSNQRVRENKLEFIQASERRTPLSAWSDLYQFQVPINNLPESLHETTILHLSDIHFLKGDSRPILEVQNLVKYLREQHTKIDLIAFTGDVQTKLPDDLCPAALRALKELSELSSHAFFVLGNHDYHGHVPGYVTKKLERAGYYNLTNTNGAVSIAGETLRLYGTDDAYFGKPSTPQGIKEDEINIVLTHNLDAIRKNFPQSVDLVLSGHTHWGEIRLPFEKSIPFLNSMWWMNQWGYCDNINGHTRHWDSLTSRTLSFVHPGLARYYVPRKLAQVPGFVLHTLNAAEGVAGHGRG